MQKNTFGLTNTKVQELLMQYGFNEVGKKKSSKIWRILLEQISSPLTLILISVAVISLVLNLLPGQERDVVDGVLILIIVILSATAGFFQDYKAERTIESLQQMVAPRATVRREGKEFSILAREVVPGDVIILRAGGVVPADAKLFISHHLSVNESVLTGESKNISRYSGDKVYKGTTIQVGEGEAHVYHTGAQSKIGQIALGLQDIKEDKTPFQLEIKRISQSILWFIGAIILVIFIFAFTKFGLFKSLLFSISLAVAAIPESLPAVMAVVLALGARSMVKKKALVRKLNAVETMGDIEVICTDKTGTITKNEMSVVAVYQNEQEFKLKDYDMGVVNQRLLLCSLLCNNVHLVANELEQKYEGSQTEIAVLKFASQYLSDNKIKSFKRLDEIPFTHERKVMSIYSQDKISREKYVYSLGAPEMILKNCDQYINREGQLSELGDTNKKNILNKFEDFGKRSLRVVACSYKISDNNLLNEDKMIWLGMIAMTDPPRKGVKQALADVYQAGVRVIMLTGDHPVSAQAIASKVGLKSTGIVVGDELEVMSEDELERTFKQGYNIFARISPFHKLRILRHFKKNKVSVAMTGDGVNDALALKQADVGIAMNVRGTEVAKEASDIILLDDHFSTIRDAIFEGRRSLDNIKKFINYLAVSNIAEIGVLFIATVFMSLKEPILFPVHILWINLITDGLPAITLGLDPAKKGLMKRPPRGKTSLIDRKLQWQIGAIGIKKIIIMFVTFLVLLPLGLSIARTALFTGFILYEFVRIVTIRRQENMPFFSNKWLVVALGVSLLLQLVVVYSPLNVIFNVTPLPFIAWIVLLLGVTIGYITAIFITKFINANFKE